jgi:oxygen-independent coproporphyrinogen III oxidase
MHLYLHIPFCRQACHYCDFHFSTSLGSKEEMLRAMAREIDLQVNYLAGSEIRTVYFGGGTPSLLTKPELGGLLDTIRHRFQLLPNAEITLEANPDDLHPQALADFYELGINRLSIGIQSFHEPHLRFMNRAHNAIQAEASVKAAQDAGITNLTIDLIYAIPAPDHSILRSDIQKALTLGVPNISAYCLTIEPQTAFGKWVKSRKMDPIEDEYAAEQFEILVGTLQENGFEQYEISNFARDQKYSLHNSAYWQRRPYLGIGPSAHSYNGQSRQYNVAHNANYIKSIGQGKIPCTVETLTAVDQVNEYLLTGLRTKWGCRLDLLQELSGGLFLAQMGHELFRLHEVGWLQTRDGLLCLTREGKLFADRVASELFVEA